MNELFKEGKVPSDLENALKNDKDAMEYFCSLNEGGQKMVIDKSSEINSKPDMDNFIQNMYKDTFCD